MIDGDPRIVDHNRHRQLVDETGAQLVCRRWSPYSHGCFHHVDLDQFVHNSTSTPQCGHVTGSTDEQWVLRRRTSLDPTWDGGQYVGCYGDQSVATGETGQQLATTLKSRKEFEATVANQHATSDGEGHV